MKYLDLSKLPTSPSSEIDKVVALNEEGNIIKAKFEVSEDVVIKPIVTTYSKLKTMCENGELIPNQTYRFTYNPEFIDNGYYKSANHPFDLILTALDEYHLSEDARACYCEDDDYFKNAQAYLNAWRIKYNIDNEYRAFTYNENGCGCIYSMTDEFGNSFPYDFKNMLFYVTLYNDNDSGLWINYYADAEKENMPKEWVYTCTFQNENGKWIDGSLNWDFKQNVRNVNFTNCTYDSYLDDELMMIVFFNYSENVKIQGQTYYAFIDACTDCEIGADNICLKDCNRIKGGFNTVIDLKDSRHCQFGVNNYILGIGIENCNFQDENIMLFESVLKCNFGSNNICKLNDEEIDYSLGLRHYYFEQSLNSLAESNNSTIGNENIFNCEDTAGFEYVRLYSSVINNNNKIESINISNSQIGNDNSYIGPIISMGNSAFITNTTIGNENAISIDNLITNTTIGNNNTIEITNHLDGDGGEIRNTTIGNENNLTMSVGLISDCEIGNNNSLNFNNVDDAKISFHSVKITNNNEIINEGYSLGGVIERCVFDNNVYLGIINDDTYDIMDIYFFANDNSITFDVPNKFGKLNMIKNDEFFILGDIINPYQDSEYSEVTIYKQGIFGIEHI